MVTQIIKLSLTEDAESLFDGIIKTTKAKKIDLLNYMTSNVQCNKIRSNFDRVDNPRIFQGLVVDIKKRQGRARKKSYSINKNNYAHVRKLCSELGISVSALVSHMIETYITEMMGFKYAVKEIENKLKRAYNGMAEKMNEFSSSLYELETIYRNNGYVIEYGSMDGSPMPFYDDAVRLLDGFSQVGLWVEESS